MALSKPREVALLTLVAYERDGAYLNLAVRERLRTVSDPRDAALATELCNGVVKNKLYIDNIIKNISSIKIKKLSVWIHNILRIGIYSLKFLDKIPPSATVNECVRLAKRYGHSSSAGYVNAVLRKAISCGDFLPEKGSEEYFSVKYSLPLWLVKLWARDGYGEELFAAVNTAPQTVVRKNTLKSGSLSNSFVKIDTAPDAYIYNGVGSCESTKEYSLGLVAVQDAASQRAVLSPPPKKGDRILDLCAAPGGKSAYMAALVENTGEIVSCDIHTHKLLLMQKNFDRLGVKNAAVKENDAAILNADFVNTFDYVLADVPCSGLGIIRRKPDIKWSKEHSDTTSLAALQRKIFENAAQYVKKGGILVYSTCTINKEENEDNVRWFLNNHHDFKITASCAPAGTQLLCGKDGTDGFFRAAFERV